MASTRRQFAPVEIYQDMHSYAEHQIPVAGPAPVAYDPAIVQAHMLPPQYHHPQQHHQHQHHHHAGPPLQPVSHYTQNRSPTHHTHLPPSFTPIKSHSTNTSPILQMSQPHLNATYLAPPEMSAYMSGSPVKKNMQPPHPSQQYAAYYQPVAQRPQKALFNTFPNAARPLPEKENMYHHGIYESQIPHFAPPYPQPPQVLGKRGLESDLLSSASRDHLLKRPRLEEEELVSLPDPSQMPTLQDDGGKPPYSYATLIGMAILRAPNRRLTLSQIYKWISDTFGWYRDAEPGWMNSIRHNLSLNKAFVKKERPKDDPGKGNYWAIEEGMEKQFLKDKNNTRRPTNPEPMSNYIPSEPARPMAMAPLMETFALPPKQARTTDSSRFPGEVEASSDATLPDDNKDEDVMMPPPSRVLASSPPRTNFDSSPPVHLGHAGSTPMHNRHLVRKHTGDSFKDSGFYSSIESSVSRPHKGENDREDVRSSALRGRGSGRAEEELARIRGSSYDPSPTRVKSAMGHHQYKDLEPPSSPTRTYPAIGFPPLTPAVKLNPSVRPQPPSTVSPNTHLRRHRETVRELVGTPAQNLPVYNVDEVQWTPAFSLQQHDSDYSATPRFGSGSAGTPTSATYSNTYSLLWNDDMSCGGGNIGSSAPTPGLSAMRHTRSDQGLAADEDTATHDENYDVFFARGSPIKTTIKRPLIQRPASTAPGLSSMSTSNALASVTGNKPSMPPPSTRNLLGSPFRGVRPAGFSGHVRAISRGSKDFGAAFVNSPLRKTENMNMSDELVEPATPARKSGLSSGITVNSPGDSLSIWDAYLAGLDDDEEEGGMEGGKSWMEESKDVEGLDLAKGFSSIAAAVGGGGGGQAVPGVMATGVMAPPAQPQTQQVQSAAPSQLRRPSFMRRVTSQL